MGLSITGLQVDWYSIACIEKIALMHFEIFLDWLNVIRNMVFGARLFGFKFQL